MNNNNFDIDRLMNEVEAAEYISVTRRALQQWRLTGTGPDYIRISARCIRYRRREIIIWSEALLRSSTKEKIPF